MIGICKEVLTLLKDRLIPGAVVTEEKVFYMKMQGDYNRYICEFSRSQIRTQYINEANDNYLKAMEEAESLSSTNPLRLGLTLNYSVFTYEMLSNPDEAI